MNHQPYDPRPEPLTDEEAAQRVLSWDDQKTALKLYMFRLASMVEDHLDQEQLEPMQLACTHVVVGAVATAEIAARNEGCCEDCVVAAERTALWAQVRLCHDLTVQAASSLELAAFEAAGQSELGVAMAAPLMVIAAMQARIGLALIDAIEDRHNV